MFIFYILLRSVRAGLALIIAGIAMIVLFALGSYYSGTLGGGFLIHQKYELYFLLFGIGFVMIGIRIARKKNS